MDIQEVTSAIMSGELDSRIEVIEIAIKFRKERKARGLLNDLNFGDMVVIKNLGMGAKYLNGAMAKVVEVRQKRVLCLITEMPIADHWANKRRFQAGSRVLLYGNNLERVSIVDGFSREPDKKLHVGRHPVGTDGMKVVSDIQQFDADS